MDQGPYISLLGKRTVVISAIVPDLPRKQSSEQSGRKYEGEPHLLYLGLDGTVKEIRGKPDRKPKRGTSFLLEEGKEELTLETGVERLEGLEALEEGVRLHLEMSGRRSNEGFEAGLGTEGWELVEVTHRLQNLSLRLINEIREEESLALMSRRLGLNIRYVVVGNWRREGEGRTGDEASLERASLERKKAYAARLDMARAALLACGTCGIGHICRAEFSLLVGPERCWIAWTGVLVRAQGSEPGESGTEYLGSQGKVRMVCLAPGGGLPLIGVSPDEGVAIELGLLSSGRAEEAIPNGPVGCLSVALKALEKRPEEVSKRLLEPVDRFGTRLRLEEALCRGARSLERPLRRSAVGLLGASDRIREARGA